MRTVNKDTLADAVARMERASAREEAPEVISALMLDIAEILDYAGLGSAGVRRSARAVACLHGLRDQRRSWFDKWRNGATTDYTPIIEAYRKDQK